MADEHVDVICCSNDDSKFEAMRSSFFAKLTSPFRLNFIRITQAASMTAGYNEGIALSSAKWLIFCHDDVELLSANIAGLIGDLGRSDVIGVAGTARCQASNWYLSDPGDLLGRVVIPARSARHDREIEIFGRTRGRAQALDGIFIAARRHVAADMGFSEAIPGFTCYDIDFTYRAHLLRHRVMVTDEIVLFHNSRVDDFSEEKHRLWRENQLRLDSKFNFHRKFPEGLRHETRPFA